VADGGEEGLFLFTNVVSDIIDEDRHLWGEALVVGAQSLDLRTEPLHHVVLLEALEDFVGHVRNLLADGRVEDLLFDRRVSTELPDDRRCGLRLGRLRPLTRLLEGPEQSLHGLVIGLQKCDRIQRWSR